MIARACRWYLLGIVVATAAACGAEEAQLGERSSSVGDGTELVWIGDSHLRVDQTYVPAAMVPAGRDLTVYIQSYPMGAADRVELFYADASYGVVESVQMAFDTDYAGPFGSNRQWRAVIPGNLLQADVPVHYWIRAEDALGNVLWDSAGGSNYTVQARGYEVAWVGGLGSYRPVDGSYIEGGLFNEDGSTSTGCWNHGVSFSSYRARAVRVYAPGLTDAPLDDPAELAAAAAILQVELFTDARPSGWSPVHAQFVRRVGNDFLYSFQFVAFTPVCIEGLGDGTYDFKLRVSTDGGTNWFWRGTDNGPYGGDNLRVQYAARCSYFNDPLDCIPTETELTRHIAYNGIGSVIDYGMVSRGASSTFTVELVGGQRPVTVSELGIAGPDGDQFTMELVDAATGEYLPVEDGVYELTEGVVYRLVVTYVPTVTSPGVLPHQATLVWAENTHAPPIELPVQGVYLRGRSQ